MAKQHIVGETALRLKNSNPEAFADFVDAVEKTSRVVTDAVTQATSQDILVYQGRAQACLLYTSSSLYSMPTTRSTWTRPSSTPRVGGVRTFRC